MERDFAYFDARRQVNRKLGFYLHLVVYLTVNIGLILLNLSTYPTRMWAVWPLFGWGIGLLFHGLAVFVLASRSAWKQRMIENEMRKQQEARTK